MRTYTTPARAPVPEVWGRLVRPRRWHEWAPHVRGAWGLGDPELRAGARGFVRLLGFAPVPVAITDVQPGRSWTWRVAGAVTMSHGVSPDGEVHVTIDAAEPLETALALTYGPLVQLLVRRLAAA